MPVCGSRIKDIESKYYVALRCSVHRELGTIIAANPSTILGMVRLGDREKETLIRDLHDGTIAAKWQISAEVRRALRFRTGIRRKSAARRLEEIVARTGRLLPKDYWADLQFLANWMGGTMKAYLRGFPEFFGDKPVRDVGLIASEGRMTIPSRMELPRESSISAITISSSFRKTKATATRRKQSRLPTSSRARTITSCSPPPAASIAITSTTWCTAWGFTAALR